MFALFFIEIVHTLLLYCLFIVKVRSAISFKRCYTSDILFSNAVSLTQFTLIMKRQSINNYL